ncbi:hypothetical protein ABFS83_11G100400 [Erythranthe nasuta]
MMALYSALQLSMEFGVWSNQRRNKRFRPEYPCNKNLSKRIRRKVCTTTHSRNHQFKCHCFLNRCPNLDAAFVKNATLNLTRSFDRLQGNPLAIKLASALGIVIFAVWGLCPLVRQSRNVFLRTSDSSWKKSSTYHVTVSYIQPLMLWTGAIFICRALDPMILPSESAQIVKQRLLNFVRSLSTVLAFAYCLSSVIQQAQNFFMERNEQTDTRNMGFQFTVRALYTAVWVAAVSLFMELLGFSTQKWLTAGGLGTVLLTLAGREILTNFLSSVMIHTTRPFVLNEWIQTKIQGYDVSGTVEHMGWWSPTIIRGDDREAIHIPNHKFSVNVVRNLSQKTHWRIKTHLAISHLDVGKINNIVADMRKVLAKNHQVEQQKLHRRVFLDNIDPENQALLIMVSCFVKTSRFEEYMCVKEAILHDLLRVITHHRARLATPIRTIQKTYRDADVDTVPFPDSIFSWGAAASSSSNRALLIEPSYKIEDEEEEQDKTKTHARPKIDDSATESKAENNTAAASKSSGGEKTDEQNNGQVDIKSSKSPLKSASHNTNGKNSAISSLEENIVLGVALDGSKRSLPIDEESDNTIPASNNNNNPEEVKEQGDNNIKRSNVSAS